MIKKIIKGIVGPTLWRIARASRQTLRCYPRYVFGRGRAAPPRHIDYEVTFACNARCRMCPLYGEHRDGDCPDPELRGKKELTTDEAKHLIQEARSLGVQHITLTGGEPFLRKDLCELVATATGLGIEVGIITNGSVLDRQRAHNIVNAGLNQLHISLDGPEDLHNNIRRVPGMFERIDRNVGFLRAAQQNLNRSNPTITVGCTVSALNQDRLHEIADVAAQWKTPLSFLPIFYSTPGQDEATYEVIIGSADIKPEDWHLPAHIRDVDIDTLWSTLVHTQERCRELGVQAEFEFKSRDEIRNWYYNSNYANNNKCLYPWHTMRVNPYGEVYPCSILVAMGNVRDQALRAIWNGTAYRNFRLRLRRFGLFPNCAKCCVLNKHDLICRLFPRPRLPSWLRRRLSTT